MSTAVEPKKKRHPHRKDYTDQECDLALEAWIRCSGHKDRAVELLKSQGISVPASTLRYWATTSQLDRLERIRQEIGPKIKAEMADMHQALAVAAGEIEAKAINRLNEKLDNNEIDGKDLSAVMQRSAIATGIHGEKHLLYSGQPTQIVQKNASDILRSLKSRGLVVDAEVVKEETVASE